MSLQDMKDTFLPSIDKLILGSLTTEQGGTYHVASNAFTGSTNLGLCFADTKANVSAYTAAGNWSIGPTTVQSYYLQRLDGY